MGNGGKIKSTETPLKMGVGTGGVCNICVMAAALGGAEKCRQNRVARTLPKNCSPHVPVTYHGDPGELRNCPEVAERLPMVISSLLFNIAHDCTLSRSS